MRQKLTQHVISHTARHDIGVFVGMGHDFDPGFVNVGESFGLLGQLFGNVTTNKHSLKIDPQVLNSHPVFNDFSRGRQFLNPFLDISFEGCVVSEVNIQLQANIGKRYHKIGMLKNVIIKSCIDEILMFTIAFHSQELIFNIHNNFLRKPTMFLRFFCPYLLLIRDPSIISESSMSATISLVSCPLRSSSPLVLKFPNEKLCTLQSVTTCFSLASISFSFTAAIQIS